MKKRLPWRFRLPVLIAFIATFVAVANGALPEKTIPLVFIPVFGLLTIVQYTQKDGQDDSARRSSDAPSGW